MHVVFAAQQQIKQMQRYDAFGKQVSYKLWRKDLIGNRPRTCIPSESRKKFLSLL